MGKLTELENQLSELKRESGKRWDEFIKINIERDIEHESIEKKAAIADMAYLLCKMEMML